MSNCSSSSSSSAIPPFHSLPFSAYYRTECQDKYSTSRLAHHVAYFDNECASSLQLTPCFDDDHDENENDHDRDHHDHEGRNTYGARPSYYCKAFVHGHQYSRKIRCFGPWVDATSFTNATLAEISRRTGENKSSGNSGSNANTTGGGRSIPSVMGKASNKVDHSR